MFFGPYMVKRARSEIKRYGLLFTCLFSRAIHLKLLDDLSTDCFLNSLGSFLALRGKVATLFCDQGTNFVRANNELKQAFAELDHDRLTRLLASSVNSSLMFLMQVIMVECGNVKLELYEIPSSL